MSSEQYEIAFLGAPRAGKSTLMLAWYELAKKVYKATPDLSYEQTADFIHAHECWREEDSVNPTARGEHTKARFKCFDKKRQFDLVLHDFSGEDIVDGVKDKAHGGNPESEAGILAALTNVIENANWIIQVCDPERLVHGSVKDQNNALSLAKLLPKIPTGERHTFSDITTGYFSNSDIVSAEVINQAQAIINDSDSLEYLGEFRRGCSLFSETPDHDLKTFFNQTMTEVLSNVSSGGRTTNKVAQSGIRFLVVALATLVVATATLAFLDKPPEVSRWKQLQSSFDQLKSRAVNVEAFSAANGLLQEIEAWQEEVKGELSNQEVKVGYQRLEPEISEIKSGLISIPPPKGTEKLEPLLKDRLVSNAGRLERFYSDVQELAARNCEDKDAWDEDARKQWKKIESFAKQVSTEGLRLKISNSWLKGPRWWTPGWGYDELRAEFWIAPDGAPCPYDEGTNGEGNEARLLKMEWKTPVSHGNGQYSVTWPKQKQDVSVTLSNQIWIRILESEGKDETWISAKVSRFGPLGLDWFNKPQTHKDIQNKNDYQLNVHLNPVDCEVPSAIINAFRSYESDRR